LVNGEWCNQRRQSGDVHEVAINVFGQEGLDHVTRGRIRAILEESLAGGGLAR